MEEDRELNNMQQFVNEYEETEQILDRMIGLKGYKDSDMVDMVETMKCMLEDELKTKYDEYKEILEDAEEDNDYINNDGIWESVMRERSKGFYGI
jgi:DNA integrity scanning protein DisA with diadenylate cyclase activity